MERAAEWICTHPDDATAMELDVSTASESSPAPGLNLPDGPGSKCLTVVPKLCNHLVLKQKTPRNCPGNLAIELFASMSSRVSLILLL